MLNIENHNKKTPVFSMQRFKYHTMRKYTLCESVVLKKHTHTCQSPGGLFQFPASSGSSNEPAAQLAMLCEPLHRLRGRTVIVPAGLIIV